MLRYFHVQAYPLMHNYSCLMLDADDYTLIPNQLVPQRLFVHCPAQLLLPPAPTLSMAYGGEWPTVLWDLWALPRH
jgi:hypothetical protein